VRKQHNSAQCLLASYLPPPLYSLTNRYKNSENFIHTHIHTYTYVERRVGTEGRFKLNTIVFDIKFFGDKMGNVNSLNLKMQLV
jgi:hypothetical protein